MYRHGRRASPVEVSVLHHPAIASSGCRHLDSGNLRLALSYSNGLAVMPVQVSPKAGTTSGGAVIRLTGPELAGVHAVLIGGVPATGITDVGSNTFTAVTPSRSRAEQVEHAWLVALARGPFSLRCRLECR